MTTKTVEGILEDVKVTGPHTTKAGDREYMLHEYYLEGEKFGTFGKVDEEPKFQVGDEVTILASEGLGKTGKSFNKLIQIGLKGSKSDSKTETTRKAPPWTNNKTNTFSPPENKTPFKSTYVDNTRGQIKGNSVTNGVQLAIARYGNKVTTQELINCAREVLSVHEALDKE